MKSLGMKTVNWLDLNSFTETTVSLEMFSVLSDAYRARNFVGRRNRFHDRRIISTTNQGIHTMILASVRKRVGKERLGLQKQIHSRVNGNRKSKPFWGQRTGWDNQDEIFHEVESKLNHTLQ